jgi:hypothetical protein
MARYRCHFLDADDRIKAHEEIDVGSFFDAIDRANAMLNEISHHDAVEVWAGNRWLYRAGREKEFAYKENNKTVVGWRLMLNSGRA